MMNNADMETDGIPYASDEDVHGLPEE